ncbi:13675_t:CDS:2, partial [Ambispora leptoticha]
MPKLHTVDRFQNVCHSNKQDLKSVSEKISEMESIGSKCVNTDVLDLIMSDLDKNLKELYRYVLDKRVEWEDQHSDANDWINSKTTRVLVNQARWKNNENKKENDDDKNDSVTILERFNQLESIRVEFKGVAAQEGIRELDGIIALGSQLDAAWEYLDKATNVVKGFVDKIEQWYNCHAIIYQVENEILEGLSDRINKLASINHEKLATEVNELDSLIKHANFVLDEIKNVSTKISDKPEDIADQTNRHNFDKHHSDALKRLNTFSASFQVALKAALNASDLETFHTEANRIIASCQESDIIRSRHEDLQNKARESQEVTRAIKDILMAIGQ